MTFVDTVDITKMVRKKCFILDGGFETGLKHELLPLACSKKECPRRGNLGSPRYHTLISPRDRTLTSPRPVIPSPHLDFLTRVFIPSPHLDIHTLTSPRLFVSFQHTLASPRLCFLSTIFLQLF